MDGQVRLKKKIQFLTRGVSLGFIQSWAARKCAVLSTSVSWAVCAP
jgi:hypothetical protein